MSSTVNVIINLNDAETLTINGANEILGFEVLINDVWQGTSAILDENKIIAIITALVTLAENPHRYA